MTSPSAGSELRQQILKAGTVRFATGSFSQKLYSNGTVSEIEHKAQEIVEIGINDLMELITVQNNATYEATLEAIDKLEKWIDYNKHDMGEMGDFIRVKYALNGTATLRHSIAKIYAKD